MCFSATASFTTAGLLTGAALITYYKARAPKLRTCAIIPLIFAAQQGAEGLLWILNDTSWVLFRLATYFFLVCASLWPTIIPGIMWMIEENNQRKKILRIIFYAGLLFSACALISLIIYGSHARAEMHIAYTMIMPPIFSSLVPRFIYLALVVAPSFLSTLPRMWLFGVMTLFSFGAAHLLYELYFTSVWCFFAAVLSALIIGIVW